jgi:hypothetical protein
MAFLTHKRLLCGNHREREHLSIMISALRLTAIYNSLRAAIINLIIISTTTITIIIPITPITKYPFPASIKAVALKGCYHPTT